MKILKSILFIILSAVILALVWFFFNWIIPFLMNLSWFWLIITFVFGSMILVPLFSVLPGTLAVIISNLRHGGIIETIIIVLIGVYFIISSIAAPWVQGASEHFKWTITALLHNLLVLGVFWGVGLSLFAGKRE